MKKLAYIYFYAVVVLGGIASLVRVELRHLLSRRASGRGRFMLGKRENPERLI